MCFQNQTPVTQVQISKPNTQKPAKTSKLRRHKLISYIGDWKDDHPHGKGKQFYFEGLYDGEFKKGKRHGKGNWTTHDGKWKYSPIEGKQGNWDSDKMHGIGIIIDENKKLIHENVIFKRGVCQMPYTINGPPVRS